MADDPYRYFRPEAREIVERIGMEVTALEKGAPAREHVSALLRLAHTLKGAARVVKQGEIADLAHAMEDALEPLRGTDRAATGEELQQLLDLLARIGTRVAALPPPEAPPVTASRRESPGEGLRTVRTEVGEVDLVIDSLTEIGVHLGGIHRSLVDLEHARKIAELLAGQFTAPRARTSRSGEPTAKVMRMAEELRTSLAEIERRFASAFETTERELRQAKAVAERLRLVPARTLFSVLERTARDVARSQGRKVEFDASGGDIRVDADVLGTLQPAMVQLVRNAVAHGIETPVERRGAGKSPHGTVTIEVLHQDKRVIFRCRDDGRGVDVAAVRHVAVQRGLLPPGTAPLSGEAILKLLFTTGVTTSSSVTQASGRGIGLDVVREAVALAGGEIAVHTQPGQGTTVDLIVPVSLASLQALLVQTSGVTAAIPVASILQARRTEKNELAQTSKGPALLYGGALLPFISLSAPLGLRDPRSHGRSAAGGVSAVTLSAVSGVAAVAVERILGIEDLVMRPLPPTAPAAPVVIGAAFDTEGTPQLVLDPDALVRAAMGGETATAREATHVAQPILVIDDSLTTRMLEQSILESAGYEVHLAASAEEGLDMARRHEYSLFLVDVEMPGMDGFTFVERTRADANLRRVPAILVTSRNAPEDRRRGADAGASAYIVKSDFDQNELLETIRKLVA